MVAGVDVEQELVLRKPKMKKSRKSKADVPTNIKAEPVKDFSPPSMVNIKTDSGTSFNTITSLFQALTGGGAPAYPWPLQVQDLQVLFLNLLPVETISHMAKFGINRI